LANSEKKQLILKSGQPFDLEREVRITSDGSSTIFIPYLNENYHSTHGAMQESMHVFIEAGFKQINSHPVKIFEVGFGTGLNCLLTYLNSNGRQVVYHSIERFPVENNLLKQLNYNQLLEGNVPNFFDSMHKLPWDVELEVVPEFKLKKITEDINQYEPDITFNLIYFDAFAPEVQPGLWTLEVFQKMFEMLDPGGILVTYCAKGDVRRTMQACGFKTERLPGPPGKWEMLRATRE
jgi:tRNA U34 5-methylaminomethyl-2-thiouridine-forming methyltransferase MnmC